MKIAVLSSHTLSLFWFRMDMMKDFIRAGHTVIALGQESEEAWSDKFAEHEIMYRQFHVNRNGINPFDDFQTLWELKRLMKVEKPDKVFAYQAKSIVYGSMAAKLNGITEIYPLIAGLGSVFRGSGFKNKVLKLIMKTEYKFACKNSKKVIFQNNDDREEFIAHKIIAAEKTAIIHGSGVNIEELYPQELPKQSVFLFIGRLIKDKGIMEYLEACKWIKKEYPKTRCLLVGSYDGNPSALKANELEPYIKNKIIEYFGEQTDVRPFLAACSTYILPSYHEGTPKSVLEAMAMGRAVITSDAPGCRETIIDGENGYLVPVKDVEILVDKMKYLIEHPEINIRMGKRSREIAEEKYDVRKVNKAIMKIMNIGIAGENKDVII